MNFPLLGCCPKVFCHTNGKLMNTACFNEGSRLSWAQGLPLCGHICVWGLGGGGGYNSKASVSTTFWKLWHGHQPHGQTLALSKSAPIFLSWLCQQ